MRTAHSQCMPGQLPLSKTTALAGMLKDAKKVMRPGWEYIPVPKNAWEG